MSKTFATVAIAVCIILATAGLAGAYKQEDVDKLLSSKICIRCDLRGANLAGASLSDAKLGSADLSMAILSNINLTSANLSSASLQGADMQGARLKWADLFQADLSGTRLNGANLYMAYLSGAKLTGAFLTGADLTGATLTGTTMRSTELGGATLCGAKLARADLGSARLHNADLSNADLDSATLSGADLTGATLTGADLSNASLLYAHLDGARLAGAVMAGANMSGVGLPGADLTGVDLSGANLFGAYLRDADLTKATLTGTDLREATLVNANLAGKILTGTMLKRAHLGGATLTGADLTGDDLTEAFLDSADLTGATLAGTDLTQAFLTEANLTGANLAAANLSMAHLDSANLSRANLTGAILQCTILAGADLTGADLTGVDLRSTVLNNATWVDGQRCADWSVGECVTDSHTLQATFGGANGASPPMPGSTVTMLPTAVAGAASYRWDFGNGTALATASAAPLTHEYDRAGVHRVTVTALDQAGAAISVAMTSVEVNHGLVQIVTPLPSSGNIATKTSETQSDITRSDLQTRYGVTDATLQPLRKASTFTATGIQTQQPAVFRMSIYNVPFEVAKLRLLKIKSDSTTKEYTYGSSASLDQDGYWWITDDQGYDIPVAWTLAANTMYWANFVIRDNGSYDADPIPGQITDPVTIARSNLPATAGTSGGGCVYLPSGSMPDSAALLLAAFGLFVLRRTRSRDGRPRG